MSIHKPFSAVIPLLESAPLTDGGSLDLANGQVGLFLKNARTARGVRALPLIQNLSLNEKVFLEVGQGSQNSRGSMTNRNMRTIEFTKADVLDIAFNEAQEGTLSEVVIGFDNHDITKNISLRNGESGSITVELCGDILSHYGVNGGRILKTFAFDATLPDDCTEADQCAVAVMKPIIQKVVERMNNELVVEGVRWSDLITVSGVYSDAAPVATSSAFFYTLTLVDSGDDNALGLVQATVPTSKVVRIERTGLTSVYQIVGTALPDAYTPYFPSVLVPCDKCPEGYTLTEGGYLYTFNGEDNGDDASDTIPVGGVGTLGTPTATTLIGEAGNTYTAVATTSDGDGTGLTLTVTRNGAGDVVSVVVVDAGGDYRIGEGVTIDGTLIGGASPADDLTVEVTGIAGFLSVNKVGQSEGFGKYSVLVAFELSVEQAGAILSGCDHCTIEFNGQVSSTCEFDGEPTSTEWVEGEECGMIEQEYYIDVPDDECGVNRLADIQAEYPSLTIEVDTEYMEGEEIPANTCMTRYKTSVMSNLVCEGCFPENYTTSAPADFGNISWVKVEGAAVDNTVLTGIHFKAKEHVICPDKSIADQLGTLLEPLKIQVTGGQYEGSKIGYNYNQKEFPVRIISRPFRGTGYGVDYMDNEAQTKARMLGTYNTGGYVENYLKDTVTKLQPCEKYDTITVKVRNTEYNNAFSHRSAEDVRYVFVIPQGTKGLYEDFFNMVGSGNPSAGVI
jgi:hypothetical protein